MSTNNDIEKELIAPCGMNCSLCLAYQRDKNKCSGCNFDDENKPKYCISCIIKNCKNIENNNSGFCYDCDKFPCRRLKDLDKRYRTNYNMSMIENLLTIKEIGINKFRENQKTKYTCEKCGALLCVHRDFCLSCKSIK